MLGYYLPVADVDQRVVRPGAVQRAEASLEAEVKRANLFNLAERLFLPALGGAVKRFAFGQESVDLARVAVALERYRLAHDEYPESLDMLTPQFMKQIPHDIINGQPLHYRRTSDGQFMLYSVGWNETDDGGMVVLDKGSSGRVDYQSWRLGLELFGCKKLAVWRSASAVNCYRYRAGRLDGKLDRRAASGHSHQMRAASYFHSWPGHHCTDCVRGREAARAHGGW